MKTWEYYEKELKIIKDLLIIHNYFSKDDEVVSRLKDKYDLNYKSLNRKKQKLENMFFYKRLLEDVKNEHFKKALNELNINELRKFVEYTKVDVVYKKLQTKEIKSALPRNFKYALSSENILALNSFLNSF